MLESGKDITFVIVGNVAEDKLVALITRYLGSIKHSDSPLAAGKPLTRAKMAMPRLADLVNKMNFQGRLATSAIQIASFPEFLPVPSQESHLVLLTSESQ